MKANVRFMFWYNALYLVMNKTTIAVSRETKEKLDELKVHPRQLYDEVIMKLIKKCEKSR